MFSFSPAMATTPLKRAGDRTPLHEQSHLSPFTPTHNQDFISLNHIDINFSDKEAAAQSNALLNDLAKPDAPTVHVRQINVTGYPSLGNWKLLAEVFNKIFGLQDVYWDSEEAIPKDILTSLEENNPSSKLHYTLSFSNRDPYDRNVRRRPRPIGEEPNHQARTISRETIINSMTLYSLKASISYGGSPNLRDMDLVFRIVSSCPNLREFGLSIRRGGCVVSGGQPYAFDFLSHPDVKFPPLEVLSLDGYRLDADSSGDGSWDYIPGPRSRGGGYQRIDWRSHWPWRMLPRMLMDGIDEIWDAFEFTKINILLWQQKREREKKPDGKTSLQRWLEVMDWSHLHTLKLHSPSNKTLTILSSATNTNLRNIALKHTYNHHAVIDLIANTTTPLESLSLQSMNFCSMRLVLDAIKKQHAKSLASLAIHQAESTWEQSTPPATFNTTEISDLIASCSNLHTLDIDMLRPGGNDTHIARTDSNHTEKLELLASAPELEHIILHYLSPDADLGGMKAWEYQLYMKHRAEEDEDENDIPDQVINPESVRSMFQIMHEIKRGKALKRLEVYVGNWENRHAHRAMSARPRKRVAQYICEVNAEGEAVCEGHQTRNYD
jgi:hypothetical protein